MSQDMFEDMDCDPDDPTQQVLTPTEFSGVSAPSSTDSPLSQAASSASNITPSVSQSPGLLAPSPGSPQVQFRCPVCKCKPLKTVIGMKNHLARHDILTDDAGVQKYAVHPSTSTTASTSTSTRASTSTQAGTQISNQASTVYNCPDCKKVLATLPGFIKHRATHRLKDAEKRKPKPSDFSSSLRLEAMNNIIKEMLLEPTYDEDNPKIKFLKEFQEKSDCTEWVSFVQILEEKICALVCDKKKKILPLNQYEECQTQLQHYLSNDNNMNILSENLRKVCCQEISAALANRLVFRISFKLLGQIQTWVARETRSKEVDTIVAPKEMSEVEKQAFVENLGDIIRSFYKKGYRHKDRIWKTRSACLCDKFVDGQHPISSSSFLDAKLWFSGGEDCIVISDNAVDFFLEVESAVEACGEEKTANEVIEKILDNVGALNLWFHLTTSHFSEDQSLLFMRDIIQTFTRRSLLLRERQKNRAEERSVRASTAPLRTHLQTNYQEKEPEAV